MRGDDHPVDFRRSPYGERGLKWIPRLPRSLAMESLSLRRAWIEITSVSLNLMRVSSRSPYGERGLKSLMVAGVVVPEAVALLTESVDWN